VTGLPGAVSISELRVYPRAATDRTGDQLGALGAGNHDHLSGARTGRTPRPEPQALGMCGFLNGYAGPL
jgi:hypothetical protein